MSLELQSLAVFGLSPKAQKFFLFFFGRNWRLVCCLINKKKYSNVAAWQSFLWEFSRFSLPDWLTSTIGQDTDPPSWWFQQWAQCWCVKDLKPLIEDLRLRRVFIGKNLLFQYSSGSCERHRSSEGVVQGTCFLCESKKKWDVLRWLLPTWGAMRSVGESRDPDGWGQVGNLQLLLEILPFLPLRELDLSYNAVAQVCVGGDGG